MKNFTKLSLSLFTLILSINTGYAGCNTVCSCIEILVPTDTVTRGVAYSNSFDFTNNQTGGYTGLIELDSVSGLPAGLSVTTALPYNINYQCALIFTISGTTTANPGNYPLTFWGKIFNGSSTAGNLQTVISAAAQTNGWPTVSIALSLKLNCGTIPIASPAIFGNATPVPSQTYTYSATTQTGFTYQWSVTNGNIISGQGTNAVSVQWGASGSGSVGVIWTDVFGCSSNDTTLNVSIGGTSAIANIPAVKLNVYPNPAADKLFVNIDEPTILFISNVLGETVMERKLEASGSLDISELSTGLYFINNQEHTAMTKFFKE